MASIPWKKEDFEKINIYTVNIILEFLKYIKLTSYKEKYSFPSNEFFICWAIKDIIFELENIIKYRKLNTGNYLDYDAVNTIVDRLVIYSQHTSCETDATLYSIEYSFGIDNVILEIKNKFNKD